MSLFTLENEHLSLVVSAHGGTILQLLAHGPTGAISLLRPAAVNEQTTALQSGCFPLVPFGNRVNDNQFTFAGEHYQLAANTDWDRHYLHGDGWLNQWHCCEQSSQRLVLQYRHTQGIYRYLAQQSFELRDAELIVTLNVTNQTDRHLPFGLGWHPYFPLTPQTRLQATAHGYWREEADWLAGEHQAQLPADIDFTAPNQLPRRWVNNGFSGWDGQATIDWPEYQLRLSMHTQPACPVYFVFVSDPAFDKGYDFDFFCFEPMSHAANGHNMEDGGGLQVLAPGESMQQEMRLKSKDY